MPNPTKTANYSSGTAPERSTRNGTGGNTIADLVRCPHIEICKPSICGHHAELRGIVPSWEGVHRILATLGVDPGRQGQKLIKVKHGWGWECQRPVTPRRPGDPDICGHDTPEAEGMAPELCASCGYWRLKRVQISIPYLVEHTSGGAISDPYMASNFKMSLYQNWLHPLFGAHGVEIVHLHCYGGHGYRGAARIMGVAHTTIMDTVERIGRRYDAP